MKDTAHHFKDTEEEVNPSAVSSFIHPLFRPSRSKLLGMKRGLLSTLLFLLGIGAILLTQFVNSGWSFAAAIFLLAGYGVLRARNGSVRKLYLRS